MINRYKYLFIKRVKFLFFIIIIKLYILCKYFPKNFLYKRKIKNPKRIKYQEPILSSHYFSSISSVKEFDKCLKEEFSYSKTHYKESIDINIDLIKKIIIVIIFAGRKKYLEYNLEYMRKLLKDKLVNEVHLWLYTNNKSDTKYIKDNSNLYKTCGNHQNYNEIFTEIEENSFNISVKTDNIIFIKLNNIYEIILNNNDYNYIYTLKNNKIKNKFSFESSINFSKNYYVKLKISIKENSLIIENNNKKYLNYKNIENIIISKIEIKNNGSAFWKYKQIRNKGIFLFKVHNTNIWKNMLEAYYYYLNIPFDIIIKSDDDIIYFSDTYSFCRYAYFIYSHPEVSCVYSNSLNNMISFTYSGIHGLIEKYLTEERRKSKFTMFKYSHFYKDFESSKKLHYSFLENPNKYLQILRMPINIDKCFNIKYKSIKNGNHPFYVASHVFAFNKKNYDIFFNKQKTKEKHFWDERYLLHKVKGKVFYPNFYSIHQAFRPQRKSKIYNAEEIYEKYKKLQSIHIY